MKDISNAVVLRGKDEIMSLANQFPAECRPVFEDLEKTRTGILQQLSAHMPNALNIGQTISSGGTYKAVGDVVLQQGEDGLYSAVLRGENGEILEHVKLEKAASGLARSAMFAYAIVGAAVGQANMMSIAERLAEIETHLEEAKKRDYIQQIASVEAACKGLQEALCLSDSDHQKQTILERRNDLRKALATLLGYIKIEIEAMPEYHEKSFWGWLFSNWGSQKSTLPEKARCRFEYVIKTFPVWCRGMSQLVLTDCYVANDGEKEFLPSAGEMIAGLKSLLIDTGLQKRIVYVPKHGEVDPIDVVDDSVLRIAETEQAFAKMREDVRSGHISLCLN